MLFLVQVALALVVVLLVVALVGRLVRLAAGVALTGVLLLFAYWFLISNAPPPVVEAVHKASEQAAVVGSKALDASGKALEAGRVALDELAKDTDGPSKGVTEPAPPKQKKGTKP